MPTMKKSLLALAVAGTMAMSGGVYAATELAGANEAAATNVSAGTSGITSTTASATTDYGYVDLGAADITVADIEVTELGVLHVLDTAAAADNSLIVTGNLDIASAKTLTIELGDVALTTDIVGADSLTIAVGGYLGTTSNSAIAAGGTLVLNGVNALATTSTVTVAGSTEMTTITILAGAAGAAVGSNVTATFGDAAADTFITDGMTVTGGAADASADTAGGASVVTVSGEATIDDGDLIITGGVGADMAVGGASTVTFNEALTVTNSSTAANAIVSVIAGTGSDGAGGVAKLVAAKDMTVSGALLIEGKAVSGSNAIVEAAGDLDAASITLNAVASAGTATLLINGTGDQTITGAIDGAADGEGVINVTNIGTDKTVTFASAIGGTYDIGSILIGGATGTTSTVVFNETVEALNASNLGDGLIVIGQTEGGSANVTFEKAATAVGFNMGVAGGTSIATNTLTFSAANAFTATGAIAGLDTEDVNTVNVTGSGIVKVATAVGANIDTINVGSSAAASGLATFNASVASGNFVLGVDGADATNTLTFDAIGAGTIAGNITASDAGDTNTVAILDSTSTTAEKTTITGSIGTTSVALTKIDALTVGSSTVGGNAEFNGAVYVTGAITVTGGNHAEEDTVADFNESVGAATIAVIGTGTSTVADASATFAKDVTGVMTLTDATAVATVTFDGATAQTITGAIDGSAAGKGAVVVGNTTAGTVTFASKLGEVQLLSVTLNKDSTTVFNDSVKSATMVIGGDDADSTTGANVTFNKEVTLSGTLTTGDLATITLGSHFINGTTAITAGTTSVGTLDQTPGTVTVNLSNQFSSGSVVLFENTAADLDDTDAEAFSVTDTALVDYSIAKGIAGGTADRGLVISANKRTTAGIATYLGMSSTQTAALGQVIAAVKTGDADASTAIDSVLVTGGTTAVNAVEQLNPDAGAAMGAAMAVTGGVNNVIAGRQANTRVAFNTLGKQSGVSTGDAANDVSVWAQVFTSSATQDKADMIDGYDADNQGFVVGWEGTGKSGSTLGLSLSYSDTDVDGKSAAASHTDTTATQVSLYGNSGSTDWMMGYASADNDTKRTINLGALNRTATGNYGSDIIMAKAGNSFTSIEAGGFTLTPKADLSWTHISNAGYTETGASNLNLIVKESTNDVVTARAGAEFAQRIESNGSVTIPRVSVMAGYDLVNDRAETTSTFTGGGSAFTTQGIDPEKASLALGFGVDHVSDDSTASFDFNADIKDGYSNNTASLTLKSKF